MRRLVCAFVVHIHPKTDFLALWPIFHFVLLFLLLLLFFALLCCFCIGLAVVFIALVSLSGFSLLLAANRSKRISHCVLFARTQRSLYTIQLQLLNFDKHLNAIFLNFIPIYIVKLGDTTF